LENIYIEKAPKMKKKNRPTDRLSQVRTNTKKKELYQTSKKGFVGKYETFRDPY
jgi:hypothetical protein